MEDEQLDADLLLHVEKMDAVECEDGDEGDDGVDPDCHESEDWCPLALGVIVDEFEGPVRFRMDFLGPEAGVMAASRRTRAG